MQRLQSKELAPNFLTLSLYSMLNQISQSKQFRDRLAIVSFFQTELENRNRTLSDEVIETKANLSFQVFENIVHQLGLDFSIFATKENLINYRLVEKRNHIAPGEYVEESLEDIYSLVDVVINMMNTFKNQIQNAAIEKDYKSEKYR